MPRERLSLTPTGASPVAPTLLDVTFDALERTGDILARCSGEQGIRDVVGPLSTSATCSRDGVPMRSKKQRVLDHGVVGTLAQSSVPPRKLSKTLLESLLLHEIRALDRRAHLRETEMVVKAWCTRKDRILEHRCVPRRDVEGWLASDGLDAKKVLQSRLVLHDMCLQLADMRRDGRAREGGACTPDGMSPRADAIPVRVLPDVPLYVGSGSSAKHSDVLKASGISYIVNVSAVVPNYHENGEEGAYFSYLKVPVYDAEDVNIIEALRERGALEFIQEGLDAGCGVLVHCCAGRSRSVACVCAYLISRYGWSVEEALAVVGRVRVVRPNDGFLEQLRGFHEESVGLGDGCLVEGDRADGLC